MSVASKGIVGAIKQPLRFLGHYDLLAEGKYLFEILCQLRNMGAGRYVTKTEWKLKWPEQNSYLKIVKAEPEMDRWMHRGKIFAEWTFRGRNLGLYEFDCELNRTDWKLVHRHEEKKLLENKNQFSTIEVPESIPLPPLQAMMAKRDAIRRGQTWTDANSRIPLDVCIDPQFEMLQPFFKKIKPERMSDSIYQEVDPRVYLDMYGKVLPTKVEAWSVGPAEPNRTLQAPHLLPY